MKKCPICGEDICGKSHRSDKKFCSLKCYWESKKVESGYKKPFCIDCGSGEIFNHGVHNIAKKVCKACFDKRWKKLNYIKNASGEHATCLSCGVLSAVRTSQLQTIGGNWLCVKCRYKKSRLHFCRACGLILIENNKWFCSKKCKHIFDVWYENNRNYFTRAGKRKACVDCGVELNEVTRTHKKSDQQCNECNYITRRIRKDKKIYGEDYLQIIGKTRVIDSIENHFKKLQGGISLCKKDRLNWEKVIQRLERLFMSEPSKTSLSSILVP